MKKLLILAVSMLTVIALAGVGMTADAQAAAPAHTKKMSAPKTTMGEVTAVTAGKNFSIKDEKGTTHQFRIGKHTKISGELKVGAKVDVTAMGKWAHEVKVEGGAAPASAPSTSNPPAEKY
jgi:hypothetical protein